MTLREFFVKLLEGDNLAQYYADRDAYIDRQQKEYGLRRDDADLIRNGSLAAIEQQLLAEANSPGPKPYLIVWPPM